MKQQVSPVVAVVAVVVVLGLAAFAWMRMGSGGAKGVEANASMPPSAAAELQKVTGGTGRTSPANSGGSTSTPMLGGGMTNVPGAPR
jgi:hypothetical protein